MTEHTTGAARERAERELLAAVEHTEGERALRVRADAELGRLRAELADTRAQDASALRALLVAATRDSRNVPAREPGPA